MKSRFVFLSTVFTVCILSSCGTSSNARMDADFPASDATRTAESGAAAVAEDGVSALHMLGAANKYGWYQVGYDETDVWYGTVIDFAAAEEREISAPDGLPMNGRVGNLQVDDAQIVWSWSGMLTDTPALVVTDFDRNQTGAVSFPQGWYLAGWAPMAADGQYLYAKGGKVSDDPARLDERRLLRLDPAADTVETVTTWDEYGGQLLGAWDGKLLLTRRVPGADCPEPVYAYYSVDNFNDLKPYLTEALCALDPATGSEIVLAEGAVYTFGPLRKLAGDALWWVDGTRLLRQPLGTDEVQTVAELPQEMTLDSVYDEDVFLLARQDERQVLYVYHLADGTLAESPLRCALKYEDHYVPIVCQAAPGMYLIIEGETAVTKTLTGTDGRQYNVSSPVTQYALATQSAILDPNVPTTPVPPGIWRK